MWGPLIAFTCIYHSVGPKQELADASHEAQPLRRRALLTISQWTPRLQEADRPAVYEAVLRLLVHPDAALQLAAVSTLQALVDDWDFREDHFVPVAGAAFAALTPLLQSTEDYDAQLQVCGLRSAALQASWTPWPLVGSVCIDHAITCMLRALQTEVQAHCAASFGASMRL